MMLCNGGIRMACRYQCAVAVEWSLTRDWRRYTHLIEGYVRNYQTQYTKESITIGHGFIMATWVPTAAIHLDNIDTKKR